MNASSTTSSTSSTSATKIRNGHCFWIDNDGVTDLADFPILGDQLKANLGATFHSVSNPTYLVYVGF